MADFGIRIRMDVRDVNQAAAAVQNALNNILRSNATVQTSVNQAASAYTGFQSAGVRAAAAVQNAMNGVTSSMRAAAASAQTAGQTVASSFLGSLSGIGKGFLELERQVARLFTLFAAGFVLQSVTTLVDELTNIRNRLGPVTSSTQELANVQNDLFNISQKTRQSFRATADLYARTSSAAQQLGFSQKTLLQFTELTNKAVAAAGATAIEAENALRQFTQGLGSGKLAGDELRSVLEQLPTLADIIAKRFGVTRGELRVLGEQGKITSQDLILAVTGAKDEIEATFAGLTATIGQAVTVLRNSFVLLAGNFSDTTGASFILANGLMLLANAISFVANNIGFFVGTIGFLTASYFATNIASLLAATGVSTYGFAILAATLRLQFFTAATIAFRAAMVALNVVLALNPFSLLSIAIAVVLGLLFQFRTEVFQFIGALLAAGNAILQFILQTQLMQFVFQQLGIAFQFVGGVFAQVAQWMLDRLSDMYDGFIILGGIAQSVFDGLLTILQNVLIFVRDVYIGFLQIIDSLTALFGIVTTFASSTAAVFDFLGQQIDEVVQSTFDFGAAALVAGAQAFTAFNNTTAAADTASKSVKDVSANLTDVGVNAAVAGATATSALSDIGTSASSTASPVQQLADSFRDAAAAASSAASASSGISGGGGGSGAGGGGGSGGGSSLSGRQFSFQAKLQERKRAQVLLQPDGSIRLVTTDEAFRAKYGGGVFVERNDTNTRTFDPGTDSSQVIQDATNFAGNNVSVTTLTQQQADSGYVPSTAFFRTGGDFTVGGRGGADSQFVSFMATPGEQVSVRTPRQVRNEQSGNNKSQPVVINMTVNANDADSFRRSQGQILADLYAGIDRYGRRA